MTFLNWVAQNPMVIMMLGVGLYWAIVGIIKTLQRRDQE